MHTFYMSRLMARAAHYLAAQEEQRSGHRTGAGQIIDRAMRRYVAEVLPPDVLAQLAAEADAPDGGRT